MVRYNLARAYRLVLFGFLYDSVLLAYYLGSWDWYYYSEVHSGTAWRTLVELGTLRLVKPVGPNAPWTEPAATAAGTAQRERVLEAASRH